MTQTTTQPASPSSDLFADFRGMLAWPEVQLLGGLLLVLFIARLFRKTDKLADARWADKAAIRHARRKALEQIKNPKISNTALYLGDPKQYPIPDAHRHIAVIGTTDAGKTTSAIDQLIRSGLEQGFTSFVYDVKAEQLRKHAAYALSLGYQVHCFAPGMPWSGCYDPMGFLRDEYDSTMARQIAATINRNMMPSSKRDDFFGPAADSLMETVLLLAKGSAYPDFLMAWAILSLPNLARRLARAQSGSSLDLWAQVAATTTVSVAEAEKTVAGIVGGAVNAFRSFISRDLLPSIVGVPTIPLRMDEKHIVFFQVDEERSAVVAPLCALMLRMFMLANLNNQFKREAPLCVYLDEFTSAYFPDLDVDLNLRRAYGLVAVLGYQGRSQLLDRYGRDKARNIETGTVTKLIFKTTDEEHQQALSRSLGEKEAKIESRSYGSSNSRSENIHKIPLFPAHQFGQMDQGEMILVNSGYKSRRQVSLPLHISKVKIKPETFELEKRSLEKFESKIRPRLIHNAQATGLQLDDVALRTALLDRMSYADMILPEPDEVEAAQQAQQEAKQPQQEEAARCTIVNSQN